MSCSPPRMKPSSEPFAASWPARFPGAVSTQLATSRPSRSTAVAHGDVVESNPLYDEVYEEDDDERYPFVRGRKPFGRITIADSDAGSTSLLDVAIDEAHRVVQELA